MDISILYFQSVTVGELRITNFIFNPSILIFSLNLAPKLESFILPPHLVMLIISQPQVTIISILSAVLVLGYIDKTKGILSFNKYLRRKRLPL